MATEVVKSYNIYVDTERSLNSTSDGDNITLSLNQTPITCQDNQYIRLTLQSFSMYKSFTNINANNNIFKLTTEGGAGSAGTPVPVKGKAYYLPSKDYPSRNSLAAQFANTLAIALATASGVGLATPSIPAANISPPTNGATDNIIKFKINFIGPHGLTKVLVRTLVEDGDSFELLGTNRIRKYQSGTDLATWEAINSLNVDLTTDPNSITVSCPYNCQLSSQQNVYLRTDVNNTNIQTESFVAENSDSVGSNPMSTSRILARMIVDNDFVQFTTGTQMEYFVNLNTRQLTFLRLYITDSHGRSIPQNVERKPDSNEPLFASEYVKQSTLGNRSWEAAIKVDIVQFMGGQNQVLQSQLPVHTVPARFGTEPLNKLQYGESGYQTPGFNQKRG